MPDYAYNPNGFDASPSFNWYGFTAPQVSSYFGNIGTPAVEAMAEALNGTSGPQAMSILQQLDPTTLQNMQSGFQHLAEHPEGSTYHGFNPTDLIANFATGGLYGFGKGALNASQSGKLSDVEKGYEQVGPWGSVTSSIPQYGPTIARTGNLMGAGAGIGGGMTGGFQAGGYGSATPGTLNPAYFGFEPDTLGMAGTTEFGQFGTGVPSAGMTGAPAGAAGIGLGAGGGSGGGTGSLLGASGAYQLSKMIFPQGGGAPGVPSAFPQGGALPGGPTPQQLSAIASEKHPGLAPWYGMKQKGQMPPGGIAESGQNEALSMMAQNPSMWMR